ncbi:MAG TPA: ABC transporter permease [Gemmatimonadota bacterium]|nr:ABC transporter permease [Gemmatimonadota bacterium]
MSALRAALFVARKDIWYMLRQKETLLWTFAMPPVFFFFIGTITGGFAGGDELPALDFVAPEPAGFLAGALAERLEDEGFEVRRAEAAKPDSLAASLRLVLPAGFTDSLTAGRRVPARLEREGELDPSAQWEQIRVSRAVYGLLADAALIESRGDSVDAALLARERERPRQLVLDVHPAGRAEEPPAGFQQAVPGTMVMFTLLVLLTSGAVLLVIERRDGLLRRVASTPLPRAGVVAGKWGSRMALGLVQIAFAMAIGTAFFGVDWGPDLWMVALVLLGWAALCAGLALVSGNLARTEGQAIGLGVFVANLLAALGGCWWPIEVTPKWAQSVALAMPTGWTMDALHRLMSFQAGAAAALPHLAALAVAALVVGWIATRTFRYA